MEDKYILVTKWLAELQAELFIIYIVFIYVFLKRCKCPAFEIYNSKF